MEVVTTPVVVPIVEFKEPVIEVVPANTPLAPESLKLGRWDPAVFATDILETQAGIKRNYEQTSKGLSVAYGKIMARSASQISRQLQKLITLVFNRTSTLPSLNPVWRQTDS
jgi:hypothetical protein